MSTQSKLNALQAELTAITGEELTRLRKIESAYNDLKTRLLDEYEFAKCWHCGRVDHQDGMQRAGDDGEFYCVGTAACESARLDAEMSDEERRDERQEASEWERSEDR